MFVRDLAEVTGSLGLIGRFEVIEVCRPSRAVPDPDGLETAPKSFRVLLKVEKLSVVVSMAHFTEIPPACEGAFVLASLGDDSMFSQTASPIRVGLSETQVRDRQKRIAGESQCRGNLTSSERLAVWST